MTEAELQKFRGICQMYSGNSYNELVRNGKEAATDLYRVVKGKLGKEKATLFMLTLYSFICDADGSVNQTEYGFLCDTFTNPNGIQTGFSGFKDTINIVKNIGIDPYYCFYDELNAGNYDAFYYKWKIMILGICIAACDGPISENEIYRLANHVPYQL